MGRDRDSVGFGCRLSTEKEEIWGEMGGIGRDGDEWGWGREGGRGREGKGRNEEGKEWGQAATAGGGRSLSAGRLGSREDGNIRLPSIHSGSRICYLR